MREELFSVLFLFDDFRQDTQRFTDKFGYQTLDRDLFESKYQSLQASNLNELAATWRNNAREVWGVDFSGIPPHVADSYKNALKDKLRDLDTLLRDPLLQRFGENMKVLIDNASSFITR